jgi:hypothetical protein
MAKDFVSQSEGEGLQIVLPSSYVLSKFIGEY